MVVLTAERLAAGVEKADESVYGIMRELKNLQEAAGSPSVKVSAKSVVEVDDLRWLLDKEPDLAKEAAGNEKAELMAAEEELSQRRIQLGTIMNTTLRRMDKLQALEEELRLLQQDAKDTPAEKREARERVARHAATLERVTQMDQLADEQIEYGQTLDMMQKRLALAKLGQGDVLHSLREQAKETHVRTQRQIAANGPAMHAAWQARNAVGAQAAVSTSQARARELLEARRKLVSVLLASECF